MTLPLTLLLAGLLIVGVAIEKILPPVGSARTRGAVAQFVFGLILVVLFFLVSNHAITL